MSAYAERALIVTFPPVPLYGGRPPDSLAVTVRREKFEWLVLLASGLRPYPGEI